VKKTVMIALAFDTLYDEAGEGNLILPVGGVIERFRAALKATKELGNKYRIFSTAGYTRRSPCFPEVKCMVSLTDQMRRFISENSEFVSEVPSFAGLSLCWGSDFEIQHGIKLAQGGFVCNGDEVTLVVATNWAHIPRVWLYCMRHLPCGWSLKIVRAKHYFSLYSYLREIPATIIEAGKSIWSWLVKKKKI